MTFDPITIASGTKEIRAELYAPAGTASTGLVVIAYGTDGLEDNERGPWQTMIRGYAEELATRGFFALIPHYFDKTATEPGLPAAQVIMQKRNDWGTALVDCVTHARTLPRVDSSRIGLLGFSLGGHLCLYIRAAAKPKALVAFFAPMLGGIGSPGTVPQAQIHHGKNDLTPGTDFSNAGMIEAILKRDTTTVRVFPYAGAGHGFVGEDAANKKARNDSQTETLTFFKTQL